MKRQVLLPMNTFSVLHEVNKISLSCENVCHEADVGVCMKHSPHLKGIKDHLSRAT